MKKIITILLSMVLLLAFTACGGGSDSSSSDKSKETEAPKIEKNIDAAAEALGLTGGEETLYELETPYRQKFKIRGFRFEEGEKACAMVAAVLRYLSRVGLLRYHCHSGYLSTVVQENEMANVLTPAGGIFRRFVEPGQEVEYGQKMGVILDPFTAEVEAEITCPTSGVVFFALKKPLTTEHEVAFKVIRRLHGGCL